MTTAYHAKYFAHELTRQAQPGGVDHLAMALFDACVDLNPHQIEAAMFALRSPLSKGVVLADEVGLGKTIEAGLVLCQYWAERKRRLLIICPASLRKQWSLELQEKFNLPSVILDAKTYRQAEREGNGTPFVTDKVVITSFHFASRFQGDIRAVPFDLVVIDEAHKLRNAYRPSNKMGQNIKWAIEDRKKCLLPATPLQNSLLELYGLFTILDDLKMLMEHFDEDVHSRLKMRLDDARANLDRIGHQFWTLTKFVLDGHATFCDDQLTFDLCQSPVSECRTGQHHLISKVHQNVTGDFLYRLSHPLGEWSIDQGKQAETPVANVTFDVTHYPARVSVIEALKGKSGWMTLQHLTIDSFDREEYLLFSAMDTSGKSLDQETCQKLFHCTAQVTDASEPPPELTDRLKKESGRHAEATITRSLEGNNALFNEERERLEQWADDMVVTAEKDLADTKAQIRAVRRQSRLATTLDEQNELQQKLRDLEKKQRKQRQQIFEIEDEIAEKRDTLIDGLQRRMTQKTHSTHLFTIQWEVV